MYWLVVMAVESLFASISHQSLFPKRKCRFQVTNKRHNEYIAGGNVNGSVQLCENTNCCLGIYIIKNDQPIVETLACHKVQRSCPKPTCIVLPWQKNVLRCICNTDFCNSNITWTPKIKQSSPINLHVADAVIEDKTITIAVATILLIAGIIIIAITWRSFCTAKKKICSSECDDNSTKFLFPYQVETLQKRINDIELQQIVGLGHFACVFRGKYKGSEVAVKVYDASCKQKFSTEKDIFELPMMKHDGIVRFLGSGKKQDDNSRFIVLEYVKHGSLHSFLGRHTISWTQSLILCQSLSQGLSYLHSDLYNNGVHKPPVAHRDLSSFNVLVKTDGTCVLCDFGCSTILHFSLGNDFWQHSTANIPMTGSDGNQKLGQDQIGTLNYMAPEILEGSVNLNSSSFLMQGDIYALSLVLWEIWMRCTDLFDGGMVPQHLLPYEFELEANVTHDRLLLYVSEMDRRPSIPQNWHQLPQGSVLNGILTDCWDRDADARLTAHCVAERLRLLQSSY